MSHPPDPHPFDDAPEVDQVGIAARGMAFGALLGLALVGVVLFGVRTLQARATTLSDPLGGAGLLLIGGTFGAMFLAAGGAWVLMRPIRSWYRRGTLSMVTALATLVLSLVTMPIDRALGRAGLAGFGVLCAAGCALLARRAGAPHQAGP